MSDSCHPTHNDDSVTYSQQSPSKLLEKDSLTPDERRQLLAEYLTRGQALRLTDDRGIFDSHRRRANNLGQFFTPSKVVRVMAQALGIKHHPAWGEAWREPQECSVVDFAGCGNGRMFEHVPDNWRLFGADIDHLAVRAARLIYPKAEILQANFMDFRLDKAGLFNLAMINPPFSLRLSSQTPLNLKCAEWGIWGKATSVSSHLAAIEMALRCADVTGAVLPTSAFDGENGKSLSKILEAHCRYSNADRLIKLRIDLPRDTFKGEGTEWPCSIVILAETRENPAHYSCDTWDDVEKALTEWIGQLDTKEDQYNPRLFQLFRQGVKGIRSYTLSALLNKPKPAKTREYKYESNNDEEPTVRLCLGGRAHRIMLKPNNLTARLAVEEAKLWEGWITSDGFRPANRLDWACDLVRNAGKATDCIDTVVEAINKVGGVAVVVDKQLLTHAGRADKRNAIELTRHSQWVQVGDEWEKHGEDDIEQSDHPAAEQIASRHNYYSRNASALPYGLQVRLWNRFTAQHLTTQYPAVPIYDFSIRDIARTLGRKSVIYSAKQGLAKTRFSIGAVLASGTTKALWVLESRLVNEFKRELKKIDMLRHFHQIDTAADLKGLSLINVITYSRLWKTVRGSEREDKRWGPGKSFAAALAKRRMIVVIDEAHKIKAATSKQGIAARHLCNRAKKVILMTGTAIQSYPRNILGLINAGWGDGSASNPYGYRRPVEGGYFAPGDNGRRRGEMMKGVQQFVDEFVEVIWYTSEFAQTASAGRKSREIPRIKNLPLWQSFVSPKLIRRVPGEPEVRASGVTTPEARPVFQGLTPDRSHAVYYRVVLDRFAYIWKERLRKEKEGHRENSIAHILPELDALRFASTAPIVEHQWAQYDPRLKEGHKEPTAVMLEALRLINDWVTQGDRVIVGAEKPAALEWLAFLLSDLPSHVPDSEPIAAVMALDANIEKRNEVIDRARDSGDTPVLLITVGKGKEGLNLPEFSKLLTLDFGWVPGDLDQFRHRILRPGQTGDVEIVHLYHLGMIDSYMRQLCEAKSDAIAALIDGQESTFDYSGWMDYRTFALTMLAKEGYGFASDAIAEEEAHRAKSA